MRKSKDIAEELKGIVIGVLWGVGLLLVGSALVAWLVHGQVIEGESAAYGVVCTILISSFVSTLISIKGKQFAWRAAILHFAAMILVLILGNLILGIGKINGLFHSALVLLGGSGCALLMRSKPKKSKAYTRRKT